MIEVRWIEVAHPNTRRDEVLTVVSGAWSFILEYREWNEAARSYSTWKPVPVVWAAPVGGNQQWRTK